MDNLFDICKCKCQFEHMNVHWRKVFCSSCSFEDGVAAVGIEFLMDQRGERKMMLG